MDEPTMNCVRIACVAAIAIMPAIAVAGPREDLIDGMAKCAVVTDNTARLTCTMPQSAAQGGSDRAASVACARVAAANADRRQPGLV